MDDGKEDGHIWKSGTIMEKELAAADERANEAERRALMLEQQLAEKERKLESETMIFNNLIEQETSQVPKKSSYNDIREGLVEEPSIFREGIYIYLYLYKKAIIE